MSSIIRRQQLASIQAVVTGPLRFTPYLRPSPWGGRRLVETYGKVGLDGSPSCLIGESWEISGHDLHVSRVAEGPYVGRSLNHLWSEFASHWLPGHAGIEPVFPLLVKLLDCHEPCSVQVHPSERGSAAMMPPQRVKVEAWVVLEADSDALIYAGFKQGVTEADVRTGLASGTIVDCLNAVRPNVGDCFLMTPGIVHAMQGVRLAEFQTASDATLRLFDWNRTDQSGRPRQLHIEESLREVDFNLGPVQPVRPRPLLNASGATVSSEVLVEIPEFRLTRHLLPDEFELSASESFSIWMVTEGAVSFTVEGQLPCTAFSGETLLIPPYEQLTLKSYGDRSATLLHCEIPE